MSKALVACIVGIVAVILTAGYLLVSGSSDGTCMDGEVRIDGDCAAIRAGKPVDPTTGSVEYIASFVIDDDPTAGSVGGRCAFQGVAGDRADVYLCLMRFWEAPITFRLLHDRAGHVYHWEVLSDPERQKYAFHPHEGASGECTYHDGTPDCE